MDVESASGKRIRSGTIDSNRNNTMRNKRVLDMESVDSRLLGLIGAGFGLILMVAIVGSCARAHAVVPAADRAPAVKATAAAQQTDLPAVERHNEVARADMQVVRLETLVIVATRGEIAAAQTAARSAPVSVAASTIAADPTTAVR